MDRDSSNTVRLYVNGVVTTSAGVAVWLNLRAVFLVGSLLFWLLVPLVGYVGRRVQEQSDQRACL